MKRAYEIVTCDICAKEVPADRKPWGFQLYCETTGRSVDAHICQTCYDERLPDKSSRGVFRALWTRLINRLRFS